MKKICTRLAERLKTAGKHIGVKADVIMKINNWTKRMRERVKWKEVVEKVKAFKH